MRILLNHFGWDKEKLLEAYYDGDQEQLFKDAKIVNPSMRKPPVITSANGFEECEICYLPKRSDVRIYLSNIRLLMLPIA
jgi:ariadne-1